MTRVWSAFWVLVALSLGQVAHAAADVAALARYHDERAREHFAGGRFELSLREFFLEQSVAPNPRTAFNIAGCFDQLGRSGEAWQFYSDYLASDDADAQRRAHAERAVQRLAPSVARARIETTPPGAQIFVDREELGAFGVTPRTLALTPGPHRIWATLPQHRADEVNISAVLGADALVTVKLKPIVVPLIIEGPAGGHIQVIDGAKSIQAQGPAPLTASVPPGTYVVTFEGPQHASFTDVVRVVEGPAVLVTARPSPRPPPTGALTITASEMGALVEVDSVAVGFTPLTLPEVREGTHHIAVERGAYQRWAGTVEVAAQRRTWITVALQAPTEVRRSSLVYFFGGIGGAALVASLLTGGLALSEKDKFDATRRSDPFLAAQAHEAGARYATATDGLLIGAAVGLGVATLLWFVTEDSSARESSAATHMEGP